MIDNRVLRTKYDLRKALIELLLKYDFNEITVKLICDKALVHKQTFYKHYKDKYDLFHDVANSIIETSISLDDNSNCSKVYFTTIIKNVINISILYKDFIISVSKNEILIEIIHNALMKYIMIVLNKFKNERVLKYDIKLIASGISGALEYMILDFLQDNPTKNKDSYISGLTNCIASIIDNNILFDNKTKI